MRSGRTRTPRQRAATACLAQPSGRFAFPAPRYEEFVALTQGTSLSICTTNWASTLATLGAAAFGLETRFVLSGPADTNARIEVRVNGMLVPEGSWTYDGAGI